MNTHIVPNPSCVIERFGRRHMSDHKVRQELLQRLHNYREPLELMLCHQLRLLGLRPLDLRQIPVVQSLLH